MEGFITVESEEGKDLKKIEESALKTIDIPFSGTVPIAHSFSDNNYLLSTIDENGFRVRYIMRMKRKH